MTSKTAPDVALLNAHITVPQHVVYRSFPAETVVLNLQTGCYHGLNPTGGRMLEELERSPNVAAAVAAIAECYGQPSSTIEEDLVELCDALCQRGLIEIDGAREL